MTKNFIILLIFAASLVASAQQDPQYNMYQFNQIVINPAYAGARDGIAAIASARQQFGGFSGAPQTICASVHAPLAKKNIGVGLTLLNDVLGPRNMIGAYGNFAYILKLNNKYKLSLGVSAGYNRFQFNYNKLEFKTNENFSNNLNNQVANALDVNSGIFFRSNSFFVGFSATHIAAKNLFEVTTANNTLYTYRLRTHQFLSIGKSWQVNQNFIFAPTLLLKSYTGKMVVDVNFNAFIYKKCWLGVFAKLGYGPGFLFQYYVTNSFRVGYSFDSGLRSARSLGPSHEVIIGFDLAKLKQKMINPRFL